LRELRRQRNEAGDTYEVQITISDGLNALSIMDPGHLQPMLTRLREALKREGLRAAPENLVFTSGRVRAGYRVGETLFSGLSGVRSIVHLIGERPGTGHHTFSAYMTAATGTNWKTPGKVDHDITKVVSGIATTALLPAAAAEEIVRLLVGMVAAAK
jgi:ethanolamine ammonia-lyase large subunit